MRRDIHNVILPVDFTSADEVFAVVETITGLIKRGIPIRWGLVPRTLTASAVDQAKVIYHLQDSYGLSAVINYLTLVSSLLVFDASY